MNETIDWQNEIWDFLKNKSSAFQKQKDIISFQKTQIILCSNGDLTGCKLSADTIILHRDLFITKKQLVFSRLNSIFGFNAHKVFARKCKIILVTKQKAKDFLNANHLMGYVKANLFIGLQYKDELVALASFSKPLTMKYENPPYQSTELLRYASLQNYTITGGLDKIISYFENNYFTDDIVTMVDAEWSIGKSFQNIGFSCQTDKLACLTERHGFLNKTSRLLFAVDKDTFQRRSVLSKSDCQPHEYLVSNQGNYKLVKTIAANQNKKQ